MELRLSSRSSQGGRLAREVFARDRSSGIKYVAATRVMMKQTLVHRLMAFTDTGGA